VKAEKPLKIYQALTAIIHFSISKKDKREKTQMEITDTQHSVDQFIRDEQSQVGGFSFDMCARNERIMQTLGGSTSLPRAWKTGTTIVGMVYKNGVVLGADTRATGGAEVMDKNCEKIHYLAPNIWCCGAGTAADTEKTTELIASNLELLRLSTGSESRVVTALTMLKRLLYRYQGNVSAALVLGGVDNTGPSLYDIHPHGSTQKLPYVTMGSGSLAAMSVFETRYAEDMEEEAAIALVRDSIRAGIFNDLGSGSNVDITVIKRGEVSRFRTYENAAGSVDDYKSKFSAPKSIAIPLGATYVIEDTFRPHRNVPVSIQASNDMEL
jgi:20S proteasome subunit beta 2